MKGNAIFPCEGKTINRIYFLQFSPLDDAHKS